MPVIDKVIDKSCTGIVTGVKNVYFFLISFVMFVIWTQVSLKVVRKIIVYV